MTLHYVKLSIRHLFKRKGFTLINLLGLSTGMAVCLLIGLYIQHELGYDAFHLHGDQVYQLALERKYPGRTAYRGLIPQSIGQAVKKEFPEVLESVRVLYFGNNTNSVIVGDKTFQERNLLGVDSNFFQVFTGQFIVGDARTALREQGSIVINESTANRVFGSPAAAIGKTFTLNGDRKNVITGVCRDWPEKSHIRFDWLQSTTGWSQLNEPNYYDLTTQTYIRLEDHASAQALEARLPLIIDKYVAGKIQQGFGMTYAQFLAEGNGYRYFLMPIKKIHLYSNLEDDMQAGGSIRSVWLVAAIAIFILFLACINFINLTTALSVERAREVGIRKTFGSDRRALIWQFLGESTGFSLISMLIAFLLAVLALPLLNNINDGRLSIGYYLQPAQLLTILGFAILVGMIAGLYPAFVLSSFRPILVLKGRFKTSGQGRALRNGLVIFQFSISVILIICTIVVNSQMQYALGDRLGFKKDHILVIDNTWQLGNDKRKALADAMAAMPGVEDISRCSELPEGKGYATQSMLALDSRVSRTEKTIFADEHYLSLLDLQLTAGRSFSKQFGTDSLSIILNQQAVADFGLKNPIGARITSTETHFNPRDGKSQYVYTVVGVIRDFHFESLHQKIAPLVIVNNGRFGWGRLALRVRGPQLRAVIAAMKQTWRSYEPEAEIQYSFLDEGLAQQYRAEETAQKMFTVFSVLAIFIACIGLLGLAAYASFQRSKEISIRKVLGATTGNIILILSGDFLRLVMISTLIAFPAAWWFMHTWLQDFAYRVEIGWWVFALAGSITALVAIITVSFQAIRAAMANPASSLRAE